MCWLTKLDSLYAERSSPLASLQSAHGDAQDLLPDQEPPPMSSQEAWPEAR